MRAALDKSCELGGLSLEELQNIDSHFAPDFYEFVKLANVLAIHDVPGGTAPARVREAIAAGRKKVDALANQEAHAHA